MDEQIEKLAAAWYEQGLIIGLGIRDSLTDGVKEASTSDALRARFGLKTAADGGGNNYGGIGDATPTDPPATPSNDSDEKEESSNVVQDEKGEQNLPEGELAQGHVGETSTGEPKEANAALKESLKGVWTAAKGAGDDAAKSLRTGVKQTGVKAAKNPGKAVGVAGASLAAAGGVGYLHGKSKTAGTNPFEDAIL